MARKKSKEQIHFNMSRVRNSDTALEKLLCEELVRQGLTTFTRDNKTIFGKPDIAFLARKIAIFCDGDFWHGYNWEEAQNEIKSNRDFWISKIERNMQRDTEVTARLQGQGWTVLQFWGREIEKELEYCISVILDELRVFPARPYRTIDLCAGIGGIRRGFELTGQFVNVLSSEIDKYACRTYQHLFGDNPENDLTGDEFKQQVENTEYGVLLAGFPCQTFSRVGLQEGFENEEKGKIFFHISDIIRRTRPFALFLENVIMGGKEIDIQSLCDEQIVQKTFDEEWWSWDLNLYADFDFDKYPHQLNKLHEIVRKYVPQNEIQYCENAWDDGDNHILCNSIQWNCPCLREVQDFLDKINEVILPIKDEADLVCDGLWQIQNCFAFATWNWTEDGFKVTGTEL